MACCCSWVPPPPLVDDGTLSACGGTPPEIGDKVKLSVIHGCIVQWYGILLPPPFIIADPVKPTFIVPVSNELSIAVAL
jgi:hypothetical protein